jgi:phosphatidylinositol alpha 1,6-mannosyltransferase
VDIDHYRPSRRDEQLRAQLAPSGEMLVGFVGRLAPEKRVLRLAALQDLPGIQLVVVGDGPDRQKLARQLPNAIFLGFKTGEALARVYASLDVFVHTGPFETFCQTVQEALAAGLPVIAPDAGGPRDLVDQGRTGFLLPETGEADADTVFGAGLRAAVGRLAGDPELCSQCGVAARRSVLGRTWPAICDELLTHYAELTGLPAVPSPAAPFSPSHSPDMETYRGEATRSEPDMAPYRGEGRRGNRRVA